VEGNAGDSARRYGNKSPLARGSARVFVTDFIEVVRLGTLQGSRIADKLNYMLAGHISHKQGYDRGRSRVKLWKMP